MCKEVQNMTQWGGTFACHKRLDNGDRWPSCRTDKRRRNDTCHMEISLLQPRRIQLRKTPLEHSRGDACSHTAPPSPLTSPTLAETASGRRHQQPLFVQSLQRRRPSLVRLQEAGAGVLQRSSPWAVKERSRTSQPEGRPLRRSVECQSEGIGGSIC